MKSSLSRGGGQQEARANGRRFFFLVFFPIFSRNRPAVSAKRWPDDDDPQLQTNFLNPSN